MLDAMCTVDAVACAERVKAMLRAGVARSGNDQRVDHPRHADRLPAAPLQLVVEEAEIEAGIVRDQRRIADELEQFLDLVGESRLIRQENVGQAVDGFCLARHRTIGIEVGVKMTPGFDPAEHLDAADLDHAVAPRGG